MKDICVLASVGLLSWRNFTHSRHPQKLVLSPPCVREDKGRVSRICHGAKKPGPAGTTFQRERLHLNIHEKEEKEARLKMLKRMKRRKPKQKKMYTDFFLFLWLPLKNAIHTSEDITYA